MTMNNNRAECNNFYRYFLPFNLPLKYHPFDGNKSIKQYTRERTYSP